MKRLVWFIRFSLIVITLSGLSLEPLIFSWNRNLALAAETSLYLAPASGTFTIGSTFTVSVFVNTGGDNVNAVEADLKFNPEKLQVVSPTAGGSVIAVWVAQPTYSNALGVVNFKGGIPTPGINTDSGLISTITFRVKSIGTATVRFTDQSKILRDDGKGTNILTNTSGGRYELILPPPEGPQVSSPTHPDQSKWYKNANPIFVWQKDSGIRGFSYMLSREPVDTPDDISDGAETEVGYKGLADDQWFFHIKGLGPTGWGGVSHYGVQIDTTAPAAFPIEVSPRKRTSIRQPTIFFETTDNASGIDHFELKLLQTAGEDIDPKNFKELTPFFIEVISPYRTPVLGIGRYSVIIRAYDRAGNWREVTEKISIKRVFLIPFGPEGFAIRGTLAVSWRWFWWIMAGVIIFLLYLAHFLYKKHDEVEAKLTRGAWKIGHKVMDDLKLLLEKRKEYGKNVKRPW